MISSRMLNLLLFAGALKAFPLDTPAHQEDSQLEWTPCDLEGLNYSSFKVLVDCAKISVPLDYTNAEGSEKLPLQLLKVNATKEPVLGSVLLNPGGPGSSGVEDTAEKGHIYSEVLGGHYNLIGFDPRGTGRTIPFACSINWTNAPSGAELKPRDGVISQDLLGLFESQGWDDAKYTAERCYEEQKKTGSYLSTAFVARDMVQIVDALGEDGMLRFWGGSYGTLLGQTFAAMFPDRVDRMLLDSVVQASDYQAGYWLPALENTDETLDAFFSSCVSAGTDLCQLANFTGPDTTAADLLSAFNFALELLLEDPLPAGPVLSSFAWNPSPRTTLYTAIKAVTFSRLYHPKDYPGLAAFLELVLTQNWALLLEAMAAGAAAVATSTTLPYDLAAPDSFWGIACSDSSFRASSPEDMRWLVQEQQAVSGFADGFIGKLWPCAQWKMTAAERYSGSFEGIKTKFPIMFVNGRYDPVTPLSSAFNASAGFEGSAVLTHGGQGHKFFRHPSICTAKAVRAYFINGTMPEEGAFCEADVGAFEVAAAGGEGAGNDENAALRARGIMDKGDRRLLSRMLEYASLDQGGVFSMPRW